MTPPAWLRPLLDAVDTGRAEQLLPSRSGAPASARESAVLVLFGDGPDGPDVLLIERSPHLRSHAGQPAFPGGGVDPDDDGPVAAAIASASGRFEPGLLASVSTACWPPPSWWPRPFSA